MDQVHCKFKWRWLLLTGLLVILISVGVILTKKQDVLSPKVEEMSAEDKEWNNRIENALKQTECKDLPKPVYDKSLYQGNLIDTHFHISTIPDGNPDGPEDWADEKFYTSPGVNYTMGQYACLLKNDGTVGKAFSFMPVYPNIEWQSLKLIKKTLEKYPDTFIPFINAPDGNIGSVDGPTLKRMLSAYPGLFKGFGEQGLYEAAAPALPPDSERMLGTYPVVRENNLVVYFHLGEGQADAWEKVLAANRDITFIWHGDQLVKNSQVSRESLSVVEGILTRNPNVYYGVDELYGDILLLNDKTDAEKVISYIKNNKETFLKKDLTTWKGFIEDHQDQVIWGTDRGSFLYSLDVEVGRAMVQYTREFIASLDPSVQEKFAYKNAEKIMRITLK